VSGGNSCQRLLRWDSERVIRQGRKEGGREGRKEGETYLFISSTVFVKSRFCSTSSFVSTHACFKASAAVNLCDGSTTNSFLIRSLASGLTLSHMGE
jgi:hypothetical protein